MRHSVVDNRFSGHCVEQEPRNQLWTIQPARFADTGRGSMSPARFAALMHASTFLTHRDGPPWMAIRVNSPSSMRLRRMRRKNRSPSSSGGPAKMCDTRSRTRNTRAAVDGSSDSDRAMISPSP